MQNLRIPGPTPCPPETLAEHIRQGTQDRPIFTRITGREVGTVRALHAAFRVHVSAVLLGVGSTRQNDVGAMGAAVAMMALVDHEGLAQALCECTTNGGLARTGHADKEEVVRRLHAAIVAERV